MPLEGRRWVFAVAADSPSSSVPVEEAAVFLLPFVFISSSLDVQRE
jgi:hypothetical protein